MTINIIEEDSCPNSQNKETISLDDIKELENYPTIEIPYVTICFAHCNYNNGWNNYNVTHSCEVAPSQHSYVNKIKNLIKSANTLLERLVQHYPNSNITCSGYEIAGVVNEEDRADWLCDQLNPIIKFVDHLDC